MEVCVQITWRDYFILFYFILFYFILGFLEHRRRLTTWLVLCQVERQFHRGELNRQALCSVWAPLHYHPVV